MPEVHKLPPNQNALVCQSEPGFILLDTYDVLNQTVVSHHFQFGDSHFEDSQPESSHLENGTEGGNRAPGRQAHLFRSPHRYIWPAELDLMAQIAGFELESRHSDWQGTEFTADSPSHVSVYRLPEKANGPGEGA